MVLKDKVVKILENSDSLSKEELITTLNQCVKGLNWERDYRGELEEGYVYLPTGEGFYDRVPLVNGAGKELTMCYRKLRKREN